MRVLICVCITLVLCAVGVTKAWLVNKPTNLVGRAARKWALGAKANADDKQKGYKSSAEYIEHLKTVSQLPKGFSVGATRFTFSPFEVANKILPMNLTLIHLDKPSTSFAAVFTSNRFPGGPILVGKDRVKESPAIQSIIVNNKISNVCPGGIDDRGYGDSDSICAAVAQALQLPSKTAVIPSSTGIIGWKLPVQAITNAIPQLMQTLQKDSVLPAALGITTTDRYPKVRSYRSKDGSWSIVGIAKGAGMIEPNMATMLSYILTDLDLPRAELQELLRSTSSSTFNCISVDGDQSTSDTAVLISSQQVPLSSSATIADATRQEFRAALDHLCLELAEDIVRNGEGTQHVIKVQVKGVADVLAARKLGKAIVNSNLVKCAIAGCDPNVGRIVGALGSCLGNYLCNVQDADLNLQEMTVSLGGRDIFRHGAFNLDPTAEAFLSEYMFDCQLFPKTMPEHDRNYPPHFKSVDLVVDFTPAEKRGSVAHADDRGVLIIGSDLTEEYVQVNADYRS